VRGANYILKRAGFAIATIFFAITLNFVLFRLLPGTAVSDMARVPQSGVALKRALTHEFGLDKPKWEQYVFYLRELGHLNLGISFANQQPVLSNLKTKLAATIPMAALGTLIAIGIGVSTGVLSAWRRGGIADQVSTNLAIAFYALPTQWIGLVLLLLFAGVLPSYGTSNPYAFNPTFWQHARDVAAHLVLPVATFALGLYGEYTLVVRSAMLETLGEDYVLTARAKGLPARKVVRRHALGNALLPTATLIALSLADIVAGAIIVEVVFSWPGIGQAIFQAVDNRDYPMLQGAFLIITVTVVLLNFIADLVYLRLDPRITG
jgi:ABC-type dipeptide/oligopeptide/nickel transport system permease component